MCLLAVSERGLKTSRGHTPERILGAPQHGGTQATGSEKDIWLPEMGFYTQYQTRHG